MGVLIWLSVLFSAGSACDLVMSGKDLPGAGAGPLPYTDMEWLNNLISSWYNVNNEQVHELVKGILETELNKVLPDVIESITLEECTFGNDTPTIKGIKSKVVNPKCQVGNTKQKKIVFDIIFSVDSPDFEFKLAVKVPLVTLRAAVQQISFIGNLRVTALFSDQVAFPGIKNLCITFTDRPQVGFNVELLDAVDIDTFGIDNIISNVIEDIMAEQLVYPGRLYVDLSGLGTGGKIETILMPRKSNQHPGVLTTSVRVGRLKHDTGEDQIEVSVELGKNSSRDTIDLKMDDQIVAQNFLIDDFDEDELVINTWESRFILRDTQYGKLKVDLADMEFSLPCVEQNFKNEEKNVNITMDVRAYTLPLIAIKQDGIKVIDYQAKFSGGQCPVTQLHKGVVYIHVHRASGLPKTDSHSKADAFVTVYFNEKEVLQTNEVSNSDNPVFDEWKEFLTHDFLGSKLTFKLDDNDILPNPDDPIGAKTITLTEEHVRKINQPFLLESKREGMSNKVHLYVSVVFRPVDLV